MWSDGALGRASVTDEETARRLLGCDVIIGCTDTQWSRTILKAIAYQYYIPVLDLGVELQTSGAMGGRVTWLTPGVACLWCQQILNGERVRAEQLPLSARANELARGYIQGLDEPAPAVVSINGVVASLAVTELLARTTGFAGPGRRPSTLMYRLANGDVRRISASADPGCPTCASEGQLGLGVSGRRHGRSLRSPDGDASPPRHEALIALWARRAAVRLGDHRRPPEEHVDQRGLVPPDFHD